MIEDEIIKNISVEEFSKLDFSSVTLLDLREPDEVLVSGIEGAINVPFSKISSDLDKIPKDKSVYVFCRTGDWSEEVTEILMDRGYEAVQEIRKSRRRESTMTAEGTRTRYIRKICI